MALHLALAAFNLGTLESPWRPMRRVGERQGLPECPVKEQRPSNFLRGLRSGDNEQMLQPACRSLSRLLGGAIPLVFRVSLEEAGTRIALFDGLCVTLEELILAQAFWIPGPDLPARVSKLKRQPVTGLVILACSSGCNSSLHANLSRNSLCTAYCVFGVLAVKNG